MMPGSAYIGHLGPIPLYVHWSAIILVLMIWNQTGGSTDPVSLIALILILIISIVLHELGHGFAARMIARNEGEKTVTITLWAFGGVCMSRGDQRAWPRLFVVLAGPAVSLALWIGLALIMYAEYRLPGQPWWTFIGDLPWLRLSNVEPLLSQLLWQMAALNFWLLIFNMLPIYPFDGGQALYNGLKLATRNYDLARTITMAISVACAVAYFMYDMNSHGKPSFPLGAILGWALWNAWISLTQLKL